jgi:sulfate adenylyltransferase
MERIQLNKKNFLEVCNLYYQTYLPLMQFVNKENFMSICNSYSLTSGIFFPFPIYLSYEKENTYLKNKLIIELMYKNKKICTFKIFELYKFSNEEKRKIGISLFNTNSLKHPGYNLFYKKEKFFISGKILKFNKKIMNEINFSYPKLVKKNLKNLKKIAGFHTRNIPHRGHEWIHKLGIKKCGSVLIQPIIGSYRKGEYTEKSILKGNLALVRKKNSLEKNKKKKYFFSFINIVPKYSGPREALIHALIRKNYGCTHFLIGRDHAGISNFYSKYASQKKVKFYEKKLGIKVLKFNSPRICSLCKKISNNNCCSKKKINNMKDINGTKIRELLIKKRKVPEYLIDKDYFKNVKIIK